MRPLATALLLCSALAATAGDVSSNGTGLSLAKNDSAWRLPESAELEGGSDEGPVALDASSATEGGGNGSTSAPADLLQVYLHMGEFNELMKRPYGAVFPAVLGAACALATFALLCCIHACVRAVARRRRRRRIRSLADSLKKDRTMLLGEDSDSDDDDF